MHDKELRDSLLKAKTCDGVDLHHWHILMWSWSVVDIVLSRPIHSANSCHLWIGLSAIADRQLEETQECIFSINHRKRRKNAKICVTNPQPDPPLASYQSPSHVTEATEAASAT